MFFDEALDIVGGAGYFQICIILFHLSISFFAMEGANMNFVGGTMEHWCQIPVLGNFSHAQQKYIAIPGDDSKGRALEGNINIKYERCHRFPLDFSNFTVDELLKWNRTLMTGNIPKDQWIRCDDGWVYDQSIWVSTINSEWDLVCGDDWKVPMTNTIYMAGWFLGAFINGPLADRFGRKPAMIGNLLIRITGAYIALYAPFYEIYLVGRFVVGLTAANVNLSTYLILQEITSKEWRAAFGVITFTGGTVFQVSMGAVANFVRDYDKFLAVYTWPMLYTLPFLLIGIDESPRWLVSKHREEEAIKILNKIATINKGPGFTLPEDVNFKEEYIKQATITHGTYIDLFRTPNLRFRMIIVGFCWFTVSLMFYGLRMNAGRLPGDVFTNFMIMEAVEIPARLLTIPLLGKLGRKKANCLFFISAGTCMMICIPFVLNPGKCISGMSFLGMYSITAELAPTTIRQIAISFGSACARASGMAAPFVGGPMGDVWIGLPSAVFGTFGLAAGSLIYFLPETLGQALPETVAEAEAFGKKSKKRDVDDPLPSVDGILDKSAVNGLTLNRTSNLKEGIDGPYSGDEIDSTWL